MTIAVDSPDFSVSLVRMTNRTSTGAGGFAEPFTTVDITPYLGTGGAVSTSKSVSQPTGAFSLSFSDRLHPDYGDTIYALVEPMDLVEIRGARHPERYTGSALPLIMRGFVSSVSRQEQVGQDGTPYRTVNIVGQDAGKLLDQFHIMFMFEAAKGSGPLWVETFKLQAWLGIQAQAFDVGDFFKAVIDKVVNPFVEKMSAFTHQKIKPFQTDTVTVKDGQVIPQMAASLDALSIWQLLEVFADRPWNELWMQDQEDGPHLVFRPVPYRSYDDDSFIMDGAVDPGTVDLDIADVVSLTVSRSDARVANFFWVPVGVSQLESDDLVKMSALAQGWPVDLEHDANTPTIFGQRKMESTSNLYPNEPTLPFHMLTPDQKQKAGNEWVGWQQARGSQLMALNHDNSVFEEGAALVKGQEDILPGLYLQITRGDLVSQQYISSVAHQMQPLAGWTTQVGFCRGTGYRQRIKTTSPPYIIEGRKGPYS